MPRTVFALTIAVGIVAFPQLAVASEPITPPGGAAVPSRPEMSSQGAIALWAERVGPASPAGMQGGPRVFVSPWARGRSMPTASSSGGVSAVEPGAEAAADSEQQRWIRDVEIPARLHQIESQIELLEARLESNRERRERLAEYNFYAAPETAGFSPTDIWPGIETYNPVTVAGPVRSFSPRSSFAHVLAAVQRETEEVEAELEVVQRKRQELSTAAGDSSQLVVADWPRDQASRDERMATAEAELQLAEFRRRSYEARLTQVDELSRLTYLGGFRDLRERIRLGQLQQELRSEDLKYYQGLLRDFGRGRGSSSATPSRVAAAP